MNRGFEYISNVLFLTLGSKNTTFCYIFYLVLHLKRHKTYSTREGKNLTYGFL